MSYFHPLDLLHRSFLIRGTLCFINHENLPYLHFDSSSKKIHYVHSKIFTSRSSFQSFMRNRRSWGGGGLIQFLIVLTCCLRTESTLPGPIRSDIHKILERRSAGEYLKGFLISSIKVNVWQGSIILLGKQGRLTLKKLPSG